MINHWLKIHTIKFPDDYTYDIPYWKYEQLCNYMKSAETMMLGVKEGVEIGMKAGKELMALNDPN